MYKVTFKVEIEGHGQVIGGEHKVTDVNMADLRGNEKISRVVFDQFMAPGIFDSFRKVVLETAASEQSGSDAA